MGLKVDSTIFFVYEHSDNFGVYRRTDIMEYIGLVFRGTDKKMHFHGYQPSGRPDSYRTEIEAAKSYNNAAIRYFGDMAYLNILPDQEKSSKKP